MRPSERVRLPCAVTVVTYVHCGLARRLRLWIMWDILGYSGIFWDMWGRMFFQKNPLRQKEGVTRIRKSKSRRGGSRDKANTTSYAPSHTHMASVHYIYSCTATGYTRVPCTRGACARRGPHGSRRRGLVLVAWAASRAAPQSTVRRGRTHIAAACSARTDAAIIGSHPSSWVVGVHGTRAERETLLCARASVPAACAARSRASTIT